MPYEQRDENGNDHDGDDCNPRGASAIPVDDDWIPLSHLFCVSPQTLDAAKGLFPVEGRDKRMWSEIGLALAALLAAAAWWRSRAPGTFYDAGVYEMTPVLHRRYALCGVAFAAYFAIAIVARNETVAIVGLGIYAVVAIFYGASFLRGASHEQ